MDASCVTITIAVTVSPCFAQGDQETSQELQRALEMQGLLDRATASIPRSVSIFTSAAWSSYQNINPTGDGVARLAKRCLARRLCHRSI
jgi:hypothetical protein